MPSSSDNPQHSSDAFIVLGGSASYASEFLTVTCRCNAQPGDVHFPDCPQAVTQCSCEQTNMTGLHDTACLLAVYNNTARLDDAKRARLAHINAQAQVTSAPGLLNQAARHMQDRAATYDKPEGERSMARTVAAFNAITGQDMTEAQGWEFMSVLKQVRTFTNPAVPSRDSLEDNIAYGALLAESMLITSNQ